MIHKHIMSNMPTDIIRYDLGVFKEKYGKIKNNSSYIAPENIIKKKQDIYNNFKCFHMTYEEYHENKIYRPAVATVKPHQNRLYIITSDFTEDNQHKKKVIGYMNKLTDQNKETLYPKLKELLNDSMYSIIWDFIKKSPKQIYIDLLVFFDTKMTELYFMDFISKKLWYPPAYALENNLMASDETIYDMYCDYVKWKNQTSNMFKAFCIIYDKGFDELVNDLYDLFFISDHRHIIDFCLEHILILKRYIKSDHQVLTKLKHVDKEVESSTKFLLKDIIEQ